MNKFIILIITIVLSIAIFSCEKDEYITSSDIKLSFSKDTVMFDTIFTTISSITKQFTVRNSYDKNIKISSIKLAGGTNSAYRLNIDGYSGNILNDIELRRKDSLYIFVEVTVDPTNSNLPIIIQDSIIFSFNDTQQDVDLVAFGQDVHMINSKRIKTERWIADKPYLIYNSMLVDTLHTLTIDPGAKLYFHKNSRLYVKGTINANGTFEKPIVFQGDRLDKLYKNIPGQWEGIWLMPGSKNNVFNFSEIKNAITGIRVDTVVNQQPTLLISNSKVENMTSAGILAQGAKVYAYNNLIANCGQVAVALTIGGSYEFYHSTIANYWNYSLRTSPTLLIRNYYIDINNNIQLRSIDKAIFGNCIIYGNRQSEISIDKADGAASILNYTFDHSLLKIDNSIISGNPQRFIQVISDTEPRFKDVSEYNYELDTLSAAKDAGKADIATMFPLDIKLNNRTIDAGPDLGAFERIEQP
ncbi:MAG: right-handed parallel beta-helix repeat-containing protein [Bacteroidales bacterium]|nr:right-handed parallel beta-helix repeat-containing protein [Bacteroidales bacterium]